MLLKPYNQINKYKNDPYSQTYQGEVVENNDPNKLKRIKVNIPLWDNLTDDQLQWVVPDSSIGASAEVDKHNIPEIGSTVTVYFNNNVPEDRRYTGANVSTATKCSLYDEDYPNTYGEKDSIGNFTMHNKKTGVSLFRHNSGTEVQMDPDGSFIVTNKTGAYIACDTAGNLRASGKSFTAIADDEINLTAQRVNINAESLLNLKGDYIELNGNTSCTTTAPYSRFEGAITTFNTEEVRVSKSFSVESAPNFTYFDPFSKSYVEFSSGILVSKIFAG